MERVTIMLAGYSRPYPYRKEIGSGERIETPSDKAKPNSNGRRKSKLAWLYSNGGINQLKNTLYTPTEMEVYPYEHTNQPAHNTRDLENIKLPGGEKTSKVSDEVICSILKKIWFDLHPVNDRWDKMTFKPALGPITEVIIPAQTPRPKPINLPCIPLGKKTKSKGRARKAIRAIAKVLRRMFGGRKPEQA